MRQEGRGAVGAAVDPVEADLLAKARTGNVFAFEEIVRRYQRRVYAVAKHIVRRHDVADDVAQDAFVRAFQALESFDLSRPFGPWICRIAANAAINHVRSKEERAEALPENYADTPGDDDPESAARTGEVREAVAEALKALPAEQRAVFVLRAVEEQSYREIADTLGISIGTVMSRLSRAREKLRHALAPRFGAALSRPAEEKAR